MTKNNRTDHARNAQIFSDVLKGRAKLRRTVFYGELADILDLNPRNVGLDLHLIQENCMERGLPPLQVLCISRGQKCPGSGCYYSDPESANAMQQEVYDFDWSNIEFDFEKLTIPTTTV